MRYLVRTYNVHPHRSEPHSRIEDWQSNLLDEGIREMCTWEQFCRFAREPERRKVGVDARVTVDGTAFEVESDMAGEFVVLLWGLFDNELYAEFGGERFGPYYPVSGPIPLHRYRAFKRGKVDERSERIRSLADQLGLPIAALAGNDVRLTPSTVSEELPRLPFNAEAHEYHFPSAITAKLAIADDRAPSATDQRHQGCDLRRAFDCTVWCHRQWQNRDATPPSTGDGGGRKSPSPSPSPLRSTASSWPPSSLRFTTICSPKNRYASPRRAKSANVTYASW